MALKKGANAIISVNTTTTPSARNNVIVTVTGTAVVIEDDINNTDSAKMENSNISIPDEILKYKSLLDSGIITEEEFEAKKKQLLNLDL